MQRAEGGEAARHGERDLTYRGQLRYQGAMTGGTQRALFDLAPGALDAAEIAPEHHALANELPRGIRLGTMSWTYPGWRGSVYARRFAQEHLARRGLTAYSKHPLLRAVEVDRTLYAPVTAAELRAYREQVPDDFRFVVKAHQDCTILRYPTHARYGKNRGELNARFLDSAYAADTVVGPLGEGLGDKAGALLFQFPPQEVGGARAFAEQLHRFLVRLPKTVTYAVEIRNAELLSEDYAAALADAGAVHCHNLWSAMPPLLAQVKRIAAPARRPLIVRWTLRPGDSFERARERYAPFERIVDEDRERRLLIARLAAKADVHGVPAFVLVDNKAEGCAPESIFRLAGAIVDARKALIAKEGS